ncbi:PQQ-binding-like beta-propeller repeat protein [Paraurantiacibacter namhicola]|uniref:Polyvinylalcohol dehydrogenase n=1 Tax=Paraurantiacibacter namhicola TaxID=645517 RepID=A0A1C7DAM6_9SPHN|nr:PQQ-binding-like beta-propeller repeat protein [Paraurantiacibacter namhicola]ANU08432.1 Polyvinylalcohol dehydrogenase precursor [Paraurantiacibacter namhicola]
MAKNVIFCAVSAVLALVACGQSSGPEGGGTLSSTDEFATGDGLIADRDSLPGAKLYADNCASCHNGGVARAPHFQWLEMMSPASIYAALDGGVMAEQGAMLSDEGKLHVAEYITRVDLSDGLPAANYAAACEGGAANFDRARKPVDIGWGHDTRRFVPASKGGLTGGDLGELELQWAYAFPNATKARSQPAIGFGAAFVGSDDGTVYAFDLETGCARWTFKAGAEVRTAIVLVDGPTPMVYFGDLTSKLYAVEALTGKMAWSRRMDDHPSATLTGTPAYHDGTLYVPVSSLEVIPAADPNYECCTFRGHLDAIDAATGKVKWQHWAIEEEPKRIEKNGRVSYAPSGAPMWVTPTIDAKRGVLYAGTGENYSSPADGNSDSIFALDLQSGRRVWQRQTIAGDAWNVACMMEDNPNCPEERGPDFDHSSSPLLIDVGGGRQVLAVGHKNGEVYGLDPDAKGKLLWQTKVGRGSIQGGVHWGMAAQGTTIYVPINDMNNTRNGDVLDPDAARPGMHALDARTGRRLWSQVQTNVCGEGRPNCDPGISSAVTAVPGAVVAGHMDGWIRAYDRKTGKRLWEFNSARKFDTVNDMAGRGGSMSGPGAAVGDGYLVINSGYGLYSHEAGNVLLVFARKR